ncbi:hypothetical protein OSB04_014780 [Centaurea solstitialis]|uniref:Uncharacterized protein n=1 Tax=Centaurea solstitialis TaxID=347529 RepID=A0AA38T9P4_9ASTR|nr:hypothetical protein OSB04_014780 [Centaurea solstitialis]
MNLNLEEVAGGCRTSPLPSPETVFTNHGGTMNIIQEDCNSSSTSSIGNNSDNEEDDDDREADAESRCIGDSIRALEEALPIRRGISTFYDGKSRSFTCLADMCTPLTPSIKDIAKPENAYTRKRRNLLASTLMTPKNKNRAFQLSNISIGRISKKPNTSTFRFASELTEDHGLKAQPQFNKPTLLKKQNLSSIRSFSSMVNLHRYNSRFGLNSSGIENC